MARAEDRFRRRAAQLKRLRQAETDIAARQALSHVHSSGAITPDRIVIRSPFARLTNGLDTTVYSDRRVPERQLRPPATRLLRSRGCALQLYLTLLFEAQCRVRPGGRPGSNARPLAARPRPRGAPPTWVDLIATSAATVTIRSGSRAIHDRDRRLRQIRQALLTLASDAVRLIAFTTPPEPAISRQESFYLLHEAGRPEIDGSVRYAVPRRTESAVFSLDVRLFTNGWIHVLEDTELAFLCMVADLQARHGNNDPVPVPGDVRVGYYGLGTDGYQAHHLLEEAGLIQIKRARARQVDGTFKGYRAGNFGAPHSFGIVTGGFAQQALGAVVRALGRRRRAEERRG